MDGGESVARWGATDCGNACQGDLRSERLRMTDAGGDIIAAGGIIAE